MGPDAVFAGDFIGQRKQRGFHQSFFTSMASPRFQPPLVQNRAAQARGSVHNKSDRTSRELASHKKLR